MNVLQICFKYFNYSWVNQISFPGRQLWPLNKLTVARGIILSNPRVRIPFIVRKKTWIKVLKNELIWTIQGSIITMRSLITKPIIMTIVMFEDQSYLNPLAEVQLNTRAIAPVTINRVTVEQRTTIITIFEEIVILESSNDKHSKKRQIWCISSNQNLPSNSHYWKEMLQFRHHLSPSKALLIARVTDKVVDL